VRANESLSFEMKLFGSLTEPSAEQQQFALTGPDSPISVNISVVAYQLGLIGGGVMTTSFDGAVWFMENCSNLFFQTIEGTIVNGVNAGVIKLVTTIFGGGNNSVTFYRMSYVRVHRLGD
jgi:hypothetical protein